MEDNTQSVMPHMTLANIANACGGTYIGEASRMEEAVSGIVTDSRQVQDGYLFVAVKGERVDGHTYIPAVFAQGAKAVLCEQAPENPAGPCILVESTLEAIKQIAAFYRSVLDIKVVGITGSVGKTSTKEMIASVLSQKYHVLKTAGNFNNEIGLPLTIFRIRAKHEVAVLEMGISDFGEMHRLAAIANPDICVITNIGWCHLENLKTRDGILKAKTEMFAHMKEHGTAILNGDDDKLCTQTEVAGAAPVFYGIPEKRSGATAAAYAPNPAVYASHVVNLGFEGVRTDIHTPVGTFAAEIAIPGEHNIYNALAATAVGLQLGMTTDEIRQGIAFARTIAGRTNVIHCGGMVVIDDCYNANPVSMKSSIEVLAHAAGRSIAVLGDMGELGADERALHYEVGQCVGEKHIDALFCAGVLAEEYKKAAEAANPDCEIFYYPSRDAMIPALLDFVRTGDTVLVKASHFMQFPEVVAALQAARSS